MNARERRVGFAGPSHDGRVFDRKKVERLRKGSDELLEILDEIGLLRRLATLLENLHGVFELIDFGLGPAQELCRLPLGVENQAFPFGLGRREYGGVILKRAEYLLQQSGFLCFNRMGMNARERRVGFAGPSHDGRVFDRKKVERLRKGSDELLEILDEIGLLRRLATLLENLHGVFELIDFGLGPAQELCRLPLGVENQAFPFGLGRREYGGVILRP